MNIDPIDITWPIYQSSRFGFNVFCFGSRAWTLTGHSLAEAEAEEPDQLSWCQTITAWWLGATKKFTRKSHSESWKNVATPPKKKSRNKSERPRRPFCPTSCWFRRWVATAGQPLLSKACLRAFKGFPVRETTWSKNGSAHDTTCWSWPVGPVVESRLILYDSIIYRPVCIHINHTGIRTVVNQITVLCLPIRLKIWGERLGTLILEEK